MPPSSAVPGPDRSAEITITALLCAATPELSGFGRSSKSKHLFDGPPSGHQTGEVDDETESLRALAHPLRLRMLSLLTGAALSAAEVARELGGTQANASYHLRHLRAAGLVEVAEEVTVRGGRARRYRHVVATDQQLPGARDGDHVVLAAALATELQRRTLLRRPGAPSPMADAELWVPHEVWRDVCDRVTAAMTDLHAAARPPRTSGTTRTSTTVSMFAMTDGDSQGERRP